MSQFAYTFELKAPGASDVVDGGSREVTVTRNGIDPPTVQTLPGSAMVSNETEPYDIGDTVSVTVQDIDSSGNRSPASAALTLTVSDTVPPPQPGDPVVATVRQVD